jgi:DNA-binding NtrC family response regulator
MASDLFLQPAPVEMKPERLGTLMSKPLIIVLSERARWTNELPNSASDGFEFVTCSDVEALPKLAQDNEAAGVLADLTNVSGGGHLQERVLELLCDRMTDLPVAMVTDEECPEPLERRALYSGIMHLRGEVTVDRVLDWLAERLPANMTNTAADTATSDVEDRSEEHEEGDTKDEPLAITADSKPQSGNKDSSAVLSGITRRFETYSPEMKRMLEEVAIAADKDVTMLLIGETGSGKTYLSNLIHEVSPRRDEPFITVACGSLPGDLIESEMFGHMKGSFTSAHVDKEGKFIAAKKGTILLDEIDVLGLEQQVKLLRVIETGMFEPVGSNQTLESQARLVVASNLPLEPLVEKGLFRPDLYYRLSMLKFELAPLRKRKPDIKTLAKRFIQDKSLKHEMGIVRIEQEFFDSLIAYPWPGNVRELEYAIQRAVIYCRDGVLRAEHLPGHILAGVAGPTNDPTVKLESAKPKEDSKELGSQIATTERDIIEQALIRNNYNRTRTAKELGVSRVTLYNKMKRYDLS